MLKAISQRFLQGLLVLFVLFTMTFFLVKQLPGGPFDGERAIPKHIKEKLETYYGLNKPTYQQYLIQLSNYAKGDMGLSMRLQGRNVSNIIQDAFPVSLQLGIVAMLFAIFTGIPTGCLAAAKKNQLLDHTLMATAMIGICIPAFVIGPILAETLGRQQKLFPVLGWNPTSPATWILPAITLGLVYAAYLSRLTRAGMLETLSEEYVRTAKAKGVPPWRIVTHHCLRGGLIPSVAYLGPAFAGIISGSVIIETIFQIPGIGGHFIKAITARDAPMIFALVLLYGSLIVIANWLTDIASLILNPRLRA